MSSRSKKMKHEKEFEAIFLDTRVKVESVHEAEGLAEDQCEVLLKEDDFDGEGVFEGDHKAGVMGLKGHLWDTTAARDVIIKDTKSKYKKGAITGANGTTEESCDGCCQALPAETDEDDDEIGDIDDEFSVDITYEEPALLPPDLPEDARRLLEHEDKEADRTMMTLLPYDHLTFDWTSDVTSFKGQRETFTGTSGPKFALNDTTTPMDIFRKFFDDDLIDMIVTQTNMHSNLLRNQITTEKSRLIQWKDTDKGEILIFLAILMLQGIAPLHVESDYFKENGYLTLKYFKNLMTYNRFALLKRLIYFTDDAGLNSAQRKLRQIQPVLDYLNDKFSRLYIPKQNVVMDESLLRWHRLSFAQKVALKTKVGVKSYELYESDTGYLWSFVYTEGETDRQDEYVHTNDLIDGSTSNATAQIVQNLVKPLLGLGYTIIMDNIYNSPLLARFLKSQKTDCFGTLRLNREYVPESIKSISTETRVGEMVQSFTKDLSVTLWRDTNLVAMISTFQVGKDKHSRKYKPRIIQDYILARTGVDRKDQMLSSYPIERSKNMAWYKKVFRRLLNVTIHNAFVIFKSRNAINNRAFRRRLAEEIIEAYLPRRIECPLVRTKAVTQCPGGRKRAILEGNHFIGPGASRNARCVWCKKSRTKYGCKQCGVALCLEICFEEYHTKY